VCTYKKRTLTSTTLAKRKRDADSDDSQELKDPEGNIWSKGKRSKHRREMLESQDSVVDLEGSMEESSEESVNGSSEDQGESDNDLATTHRCH